MVIKRNREPLKEISNLQEELTKINTSIIPEEPDTNKIHQQICHCRNNQVMPIN